MLLKESQSTNRSLTGPQSLKVLAYFVGLALWFPAIGVPVGSVWLQPTDFVILLSYPFVVANLPKLSLAMRLISITFLFSIILSFLAGGKITVLAYYLIFTLPFMLLFYQISLSAYGRRSFLQSFLFAGAVSCLIAIAQKTLGGQYLDFRNNGSFALPQQYERGFAVFPEVSTYATHVIYFVGILLTLYRLNETKILSRIKQVALFSLGGACLLLSASSSVIFVAPALLATMLIKTGRATIKNILIFSLWFAFGIIVLQLYISDFYIVRSAVDSGRSISLRYISIRAGLSTLPNMELFGVGIGNNDLISPRAIAVAKEVGFPLILIPKGINSSIVSRIFEEGYLGLVNEILGVFLLMTLLRLRGWSNGEMAIVSLCFGSFLVAAMVTGYRGIYMDWVWLCGPAGLLRSRALAEAATLRELKNVSPMEGASKGAGNSIVA